MAWYGSSKLSAGVAARLNLICGGIIPSISGDCEGEGEGVRLKAENGTIGTSSRKFAVGKTSCVRFGNASGGCGGCGGGID